MLLLRGCVEVCVEVLEHPTVEALASALPMAHAVILVGEQPELTREMIQWAPHLVIAARMGAGFDNFDIAALTERGIPLITTSPIIRGISPAWPPPSCPRVGAGRAGLHLRAS